MQAILLATMLATGALEPVYIETQQDMIKLIMYLEENPQEKIKIYSKGMKGKGLRDLYDNTLTRLDANLIPNTKLLHTYSTEHSGYTLTIKETTPNEKPLNEQIEDYNNYIKSIVDAASQHESVGAQLVSVYEQVYDKLVYTAEDSREMNAGNYFNGKTSCTGFSKIVSDALTQLNIPNHIVFTDSHYWVLANDLTIIDVATDRLQGKKYLTLGVSTKEHLAATEGLPFSTNWFFENVPNNKETLIAYFK